MGAPPPPASPSSADFGEMTMVVPPLTPSWSTDPGTPSAPDGSGPGSSDPGSTGPMPAPVASPEDVGDRFNSVAPPPPPSWASEPPSALPQPPAQPQPPVPQNRPVDEFERKENESIVPDSWFRNTNEQRQPQEEQATQQWSAQPPMQDQGWGGGAPVGQYNTQYDPPMSPMDSSLGQPMPMGGPGGPGMPGGPSGPMGPDGMHGGYYPPPPGSSSGQASKPLLIAVSALVTIAVVAVGLVLWPGGGDDKTSAVTTPSPSPSQNTPVAQKEPLSSPAKLQATQVNKVLNSSAGTRRVLSQAITATSRCRTLPAAIRGFQKVAQHRRNQVNLTNRLQVDRLRNGGRMQSELRESFQASLDADLRLLAWANKARRGCKGKPRPDVAKAPGRIHAERRATLAKKQFIALWNPVAKQAGLPSRAWNGL